jgi:NAD+ kinase
VAVRRAAVVTHGKRETIGPALTRLARVASECGVELLLGRDDADKHGVDAGEDELESADVAVVLGGDGTMLRALQRFLGTSVPAIGVNFGSVGFLTSIKPEALERDVPRVFAGEYGVIELPTLDARAGGQRGAGVNDVVITSSVLGRMVMLEWSVGGENLGVQPCDGVICATPTGSTGYNLSNGGPVMVWGLDALVVTFIAPHSLDARPLVAPRTHALEVRNVTPDVAVSVLVDGHALATAPPGEAVRIGLGGPRGLLATLPEATFFTRYRETFT